MGADSAPAAFATVADLEARWRQLDAAERCRAEVLLEDASAFLASVAERHGVDTEAKAAALRMLCCDLAQRRMEAAGAAPMTSLTMQAGSFMQTASYAQPTRRFRLYDEDLELLGVDVGGSACCVYPYGRGDGR